MLRSYYCTMSVNYIIVVYSTKDISVVFPKHYLQQLNHKKFCYDMTAYFFANLN